MYNILATGSKGNAVIYYGSILVDCGVPYSVVKPYIKDISLVLLSHAHSDHLNIKTLGKMQFERPGLRVGCGTFMVDLLQAFGIRNIDIYEIGKIYDYGNFKISPVKLYHDIENFGYRIFKDTQKIFHATDTAHLQGIMAKNYDLYALECNYDETHIWDVIREKENRGEYAHQRGAMNSHLSVQQAQDFVLKNAGENYKFIMLHQSNDF
jgi:phosphoribosyl 1,2-cyclic phosphodiesterase